MVATQAMHLIPLPSADRDPVGLLPRGVGRLPIPAPR